MRPVARCDLPPGRAGQYRVLLRLLPVRVAAARAAHGGGYLPSYIGRSDNCYSFDPRCRHTLADYEQVATDVDGQLVKPGTAKGRKVDRMRTHLSDAAGYLVAELWPLRRLRKRRLAVVVGEGT